MLETMCQLDLQEKIQLRIIPSRSYATVNNIELFAHACNSKSSVKSQSTSYPTFANKPVGMNQSHYKLPTEMTIFLIDTKKVEKYKMEHSVNIPWKL